MLRRLGIRAKVLAVLAVPMLVLFGAGVYISVSAINDYRYAAASRVAIESGKQLIDYTDALMAERIAMLTGASSKDVQAAQAATDAARSQWEDAVSHVDRSRFPASVTAALDSSLVAGEKNVTYARSIPDDRKTLAASYEAAIDPQMAVGKTFANVLQDRDAAAYLTAINDLGATSDDLVAELVQGLYLFQSVTPDTDAQTYGTLAAATEVDREQARASVKTLGRDELEVGYDDPSADFANDRRYLQTGDATSFALVDPKAYAADIQQQLATLDTIQKQALSDASTVADRATSDARSRALLTIGIAILAALASILVAFTVARTIVNPLRRLTRAAADVRDELPRLVSQMAIPGQGPEIALDPIPVRSRDEVGRLAEAFNSVNATTVQVAQEQAALRGSIAEMFVNVARRDQVLLNRQLSFIDSLERAEEDPSTLANLFRLDHLATRMRRNAESLLVLAGIDTGRRLRDAMPLSDVIRTASSEIEQYDRVELDLQVDPPMLGFNALGAAHMLAELLENATIFSEPETPVTVTTGISGPSVVVRIIDHGLGMTDAEIEAANTKILSTSASDALGAQRLGLFVVGRIAQRLGAEVTLMKSSRGTGTETVVRFPATLFASGETSQFGAPSQVSAVGPVAEPLPEVEAPVVEEVDLAALTDGQTSLGLPRRRRGDADSDSGAIPLPAVVSAVSPPAETGLPTRPRKTFDEDNIVLPDAPSGNLSQDLSSSAGAEWTPPVVAAGGGLPSRSRAATSAWQAPDETPTPAEPAPASPAARAGLFSGFRGRDALAEGDQVGAAAAGSDDASHGQVRAPWMALGGAHAAPAEAVVVPGLAPEDEQWAPAVVDEPAQAGLAAATAAESDVWVPGFADGDDASPAAEGVADEPVADEPAAEEPLAEEPVAEEPVEAQAEQAWAGPVSFDAPSYDAPAEEAVTGVAEYAEPAAEHAAAEPEPVWAPSFEPAAEVEPVVAEPVVAEPVWAPSFEQPAAEAEPVVAEPVVTEPAWAPSFEPAAEAEPVWAPDEAAAEAPLAEREPVDEPVWAPSLEPAAEAPVAEREPVDEPVWAPSFEPAAELQPVAEPVEAAAYAAPVEAVADVEQPAEHVVAEPVAEVAAVVAERVLEAEPVAARTTPTSFTGYSGYAGWSGQAARGFVGTPLTGNEFERTLDEARAWHTGAIPLVSHGAAESRAAEAASATLPFVPRPVEGGSSYAAPAAEPTYETPVEPEPAYETPVEPEPAVAEPAAEADQTAWPVASWETPAWEAPSWAQPAEAQAALVEPAAVAPEPVAPEPVVEPEPFVVPALEAEPVAEQLAPAWPTAETAQADVESPTQLFTPVEAEAAQAPAVPAPVAQAEPVAPSVPSWAPSTVPAVPQADVAFHDLVAPAAEESGKKKRRGLFGRRKEEKAEAAPAYTPTPPAPEASLPVRTSAWTTESAAEAPAAPAAPAAWPAASWQAPAPAPVAAAPVAPAPEPVAPAPAAAGGWTPPEWTSGPAGQPAISTVPHPTMPQAEAPRIGALDDEVAAMLALRSDIQEQALAELSQLSSYRPSAVRQSERLTKRVPTAIPASEPAAESAPSSAPRDAEQLRSRLSSFQSGSVRGRQAATDTPQNGQQS